MAYDSNKDFGKYAASTSQSSYYTNTKDLADPASKAYAVTPVASELPRYAKRLEIFVPAATAVATVQVVLISDPDSSPVTLTYGPGNWKFDGFVRRVVAVTGAGVLITALAD